MCFDLDSRPPIAPLAGAAVDGRRVDLQSADGTRFLAFEAQAQAQAQEASGAGVVIFPDVRGLHHFYEELALRFAERGVNAVAVDYFGRTADSDDRGESFEFMPHVDQIDWRNVMADAAAARDRLVEHGARDIFTMGFCMGGRLAFVSASQDVLGLSGAIGFYGSTVGAGRGDTPAPVDLVHAGQAPVMGLFGGADQGIPQSMVDAYGEALADANVDHELVVYPDAPHSFFDRKAADFKGESEDAWAKVMEFIHRNAA
jgi:carboxymethylenebutenolidase